MSVCLAVSLSKQSKQFVNLSILAITSKRVKRGIEFLVISEDLRGVLGSNIWDRQDRSHLDRSPNNSHQSHGFVQARLVKIT